MKDGKWTTSLDGELFNGEIFDTKEEAIEYMKNDLSTEDLKQGFWVGQIVEVNAIQCVDADDVIDDAWQRANDEYGECAEDWLTDVGEKEKQQLNDLLQKWFAENNLEPYFYSIINSQKITLT